MEILGYLFIFLGMGSFLISAIGLVRMPDVYTRMHVGTKATTMGTLLVILGAIFIEPSWALKLILLALFILLTNPLSSSVIARATHSDGATLDVDALKKESK
ncbi:MAG: monovalent cation/H(+) antiporter subunit G [Campylobacterota bacterium]|nr:monovalent cation/H(+) antiporter subunit G [Campylobacterota bacterium]